MGEEKTAKNEANEVAVDGEDPDTAHKTENVSEWLK